MRRMNMLRITRLQRVIVSGIMIATALLLRTFTAYANLADYFLLAAAVVAGYSIAFTAVRSLRYKVIGIDLLVTIAVVGAFFIGEYFEMAAVTFLFMFGHYLESRTLEKTRSSIKALLDMAPDRARVLREGTELDIAPDEVEKGDIVIVRPGEKIPVDGSIRQGNAYVNQAAITGESIPVGKQVGDEVFSGTIVESGYMQIVARRVGDDTTFARILEMVEEAQDKKAKTQQFMESFAKYYTPAIILLTFIVYLFSRDLELSLTLLVIACPGALVISVPVSVVAGIGNGARKGILIKGGEIMEKMGKVKVVAFDKTGTLTVGKPQVTKVRSSELAEAELIRLAASAEMYSEHPLAGAILEKAGPSASAGLIRPTDSEIIAGQGLSAQVEDRQIAVGNRKLMQNLGVEITAATEKYVRGEEERAQTAVFVAVDNKLAGIISIADALRPDSAELVRNLKNMGLTRVVMLTGDNELTAKAIARQVGLDDYYAALLPEDKVSKLNDLRDKYGMTAMVGDGVNDAPALASADLGIAIGGAGKDVAMETADVVLMADDLKKTAYALGLSRATVRNMKQNIYFAIAVVLALIVGVLARTVFLSVGMLVHELSVLFVIINAVRLLKYRSGDQQEKQKAGLAREA